MTECSLKDTPTTRLAALQRACQAVELCGSPDAAYEAISAEIWRLCHYTLLTFTVIESVENCKVRRIWSSHPLIYPVNGTKSHPDNAWIERVLVNKKYFLCRNRDEIRAYMYDHEKIINAGSGSLINLPLICAGRVLGTVNINCEENAFNEELIVQLQLLCSLAVAPAMISANVSATAG
jgi:hypothetical protein